MLAAPEGRGEDCPGASCIDGVDVGGDVTWSNYLPGVPSFFTLLLKYGKEKIKPSLGSLRDRNLECHGEPIADQELAEHAPRRHCFATYGLTEAPRRHTRESMWNRKMF
jgi:hypothetical protein